MPILIYLGLSKNKDKKYTAIFRNPTKTIHFGAKGYDDYTTHKDDKRKQAYIKRHQTRENWNDPLTAGTMSRYILWNKKDINESIKDYVRRFNIEDRRI